MKKEDFYDASGHQFRAVAIGDKVRFLNTVGGGTVTAFHGKDQVLVEDEDGFDIPVLIAECVVIEPAMAGNAAVRPSASVTVEQIKPKIIVPNPGKVENSAAFNPEGEQLNISMAFVLTKPKDFVNTDFETYIINESNYNVYFNYMSCKNRSWTSRCHDIVESDTKMFVEEFEKQSANEIEHLCVQMLAFKDGQPFALKRTMTVEFRFDTVKFYKRHCFIANDFFDEDAIIVPLVVNDTPQRQMLISAEELENAMISSKRRTRKHDSSTSPVGKPKTIPPAILEIDLHINQLLDTTNGMSNADILEYQMLKFHETMKENLNRIGQRIVFIHGKGEGVLRLAIEKELRSIYKNRIEYQDASFREYGYGATMVTIRTANFKAS
ncbi:MAG: DUF2027 domain-containing protein [Tannerella sp.]|nr:DUF2027 domain-containing protein [Tannerella sp.]